MQFLGVDTGGTFTDFVFFDGENYEIYKLLSTPEDPSIAIKQGADYFQNIELKKINLIHGSTVATNALLERKGANVLLLTTKGFEDVIEIGRQNRDKLYDLFWTKRPHLVKKENRLGLAERISASGEILKPLESSELEKIGTFPGIDEIEAIALCFLNSYMNPAHEIQAKEALSKLNIPVSISSELIPEYREYERASTTVANSYLIPKVMNYMKSLRSKFKDSNIYVMQSNGGIITPERAGAEPVRIVTSGPAGGVVGAFSIAKQMGIEKIITYDMGGTSTDISLCDGSLKFTTESIIDGIPVKTPMIDIYTIGAGGGSIAYVDKGGALKVGPESSGADPGPACYGKGVEPTVTDANLVLGRIQSENFLGGRMKVYPEMADKSVGNLADNFGIDEFKMAEMIIKVANSNMERAIKVISVDKGYDPRDFALISFGGAGGLHACELAREIGIKKIVFPVNPGVLSALGMLYADSFKDYSKGFFHDCSDLDINVVDNQYMELENRAKAEFDQDIEFERMIDVRYKGQSHELTVPFSRNFVREFHKIHLTRYGFNNLEDAVEIVTIRLRAVINRSDLRLPLSNVSKSDIEIKQTRIHIDNKKINADCYIRSKLYPEFGFNGPAIVTEETSTLFIPGDFSCRIDSFGNIISEVD